MCDELKGFLYPITAWVYSSGLYHNVVRFLDMGMFCFSELTVPVSRDKQYADDMLATIQQISESIEKEAHATVVNMRRLRRKLAKKSDNIDCVLSDKDADNLFDKRYSTLKYMKQFGGKND